MSTWIKRISGVTRRAIPLLVAGLLLSLPTLAEAQKWPALSANQREALAPIEKLWDSLPEKQQKRLLSTARHFKNLSPEKKQRFLKNLADWSRLSPEQRDKARAKYKAFKRIPKEKREEVKRMVLEQEAEKAKEAQIDYAPEYRDETPAEAEKSEIQKSAAQKEDQGND